MEDVLRSGKGSILNEDLEFIQISNSGIHLHPGFFYYGYKEYYAFPDNRAVHSLGGGSSVSVPKSTIQINQNYPFYVLDDSPTDRFIATNNPADSGEGYRKISDLSQYIDTLDGLTAYSFAQNPKEFTISDTGDNYEFNFYSEDTGTKHLIYVPDPNWQNSTDEHITVEIPDPYKYPELLNKFLCITDDKIIIAPNAISIYYPNKQYRIGDDIPVLITVRGTKGEVAPNYPLTINNTNVTTDSDGMVETTVTAAPGYIHVHTRSGAILPSIYASSCTDASRFVLIERLRDIYGALL
jgi:hypothetical protein